MEQDESSLLEIQTNGPEPKQNSGKMKIAFVAIIVFVFALLLASGFYNNWKIQHAQDVYNQQVAEQEAKITAEKMADTYGGKSPAETLQMYIDAVKKGDYELASKYFIAKNRESDLTRLNNSKIENLTTANIILGQTLDKIRQGSGGYNEEKTGFTITDPIFIDFTLYPNGIWKIIEI